MNLRLGSSFLCLSLRYKAKGGGQGAEKGQGAQGEQGTQGTGTGTGN